MAVKIRLARAGAKKAPFYRIVATDKRNARDGRFIEILGRYNPRSEPSMIEMDVEKVEAWLEKGAEISETCAKLLAIAKDPEAASAPEGKTKVSAKDQAREEAAKKAAEDAAAAEAEAAEEAPAEEAAEEAPSEEAEEAPAEEEPAAEEEAPAEEATDDAEETADDSDEG